MMLDHGDIYFPTVRPEPVEGLGGLMMSDHRWCSFLTVRPEVSKGIDGLKLVDDFAHRALRFGPGLPGGKSLFLLRQEK